MPQLNEADTCRKLVVPALQAVGWDAEPHSIAEQRTITDGRIVPVGKGFVRKPPKRVDYLLRYTRDFPLAVVEAKAAYKSAADGLQQSKYYAEMLGLKFAYATNGHEPPFLTDEAKKKYFPDQLVALIEKRWLPATEKMCSYAGLTENDIEDLLNSFVDYSTRGPQQYS